jgi:hypothetical protein
VDVAVAVERVRLEVREAREAMVRRALYRLMAVAVEVSVEMAAREMAELV